MGLIENVNVLIYDDGGASATIEMIKGITPLYKNVPSFTKDYITTVRPAVSIPASMEGKTITFYAAFIEAGKIPPVSKLSDLTPTTRYVILMDKSAAEIN
ncbi:MAG: hypothetical protein P8123_06080 [bacterium]